jgi:hypothetical protein
MQVFLLALCPGKLDPLLALSQTAYRWSGISLPLAGCILPVTQPTRFYIPFYVSAGRLQIPLLR